MQYVGFWLAYTLPTVVFLLCPIVLFLGRNRYVRSPPTGSVLATALRLWRYAARGRWSLNPVTCVRRLRASGFWDDAKPSAVEKREGSKPTWMTFDDQWVDEVRRGLAACAVFCWSVRVSCPLSCSAYPSLAGSPFIVSLIEISLWLDMLIYIPSRAHLRPVEQQSHIPGRYNGHWQSSGPWVLSLRLMKLIDWAVE
jgi:hypothetical protein